MERMMLVITGKLRRVRILRFIFSVLLFPLRLPLILLYLFGEQAEKLDNFIQSLYVKFEYYFVYKFNLNEVARKQYKNQPDKFK